MERIFGVPTSALAVALGAVWLLVAAVLVRQGVRNRVLVRLALRHIPRRRAQTALVVLGLMLSTTIVTTALGTGDTMSHAVRSVVAASLGRADEVIVPGDGSGWRERRRALQGLRRGDVVASAADGSFPYAEYERIAGATRGSTAIAGMAPAVVELRTVVDQQSRLTAPDVKLLAAPDGYTPALGPIAGPGGPVRLADLGPNEVYINAEAAGALMAAPGHQLRITDDADGWQEPVAWEVRVKEVVRAPELAGAQATVLVPLRHVWSPDSGWGEDGQINAILVANKGDAESSVDASRAATRELRNAIADRQVAAQLHALMSAPEFRRELGEFVARFEEDADPTDEEELRLLRGLLAELHAGGPTPEFVSLMGDPELVAELGRFAGSAWNLDSIYEAGDLLSRLHPLSVREIKRVGIERADTAGSVLTSIFVVLGLFSIAVGTMLVFLIWVMLAAERRSEMGTARAVGVQRRHLVQMFLFEGAVYSLLSSAAGVLAGVLVGRLAVSLLADTVRRYGVEIEPYFAPRSLLIAFCLGGLLTFSVVAWCSWRVSRLNIVAAIRDLPDGTRDPAARRGVLLRLGSAPARAASLGALGAALLLAAARWRQVGAWGLGMTALALALAVAVRWLLARAGVRWAGRGAWSVAGLGLLLYWGRPLEAVARPLDLPVRGHVEVFVLAGVLMVAGAVLVVAQNLSIVLRAMELALGRMPRAAAVLRTAVAYPRSAVLRTGMVLAMFGLVIFTMVVGSVLTSTAGAAYTDTSAMTGGFELTATSQEPISSIGRALASASSIKPGVFAAAGSSAELGVEALRPDIPVARWQPSRLAAVDDGWLRGADYPLLARADEFDTDAELWRALRARPGLALALPSGGDGGGFRADSAFSPLPVWVRDTRGGGSVRLTVVGLLDPRAALGGELLTAARNVRARFPAFDWSQHAFKLAPGQDARRAALGLELSFTEQQLNVDLSGEAALRREAVRILLNYVLTGFMGLGLVVGIAALGVIATRAVVERRRQIATLRAIGFKPVAVQLGLLLEASLVAALGIAIGVTLGLVVSRNVVGFVATDFPEMVWTVPWRQVALLSLAAWVCVLLTTALPAWQAARIPPAEGVRTL